ncbi:hypothetical protein BDZ97DRAFT_1042457 [Flammula alnicola]|nr:hypothetical protein BDZ97DRAFT_1042457 [Flammula alnicola]
MGLGTTVKNMLASDINPATDAEREGRRSSQSNEPMSNVDRRDTGSTRDTSHSTTNKRRGSIKPPAGAGLDTSAVEIAQLDDLERARSEGNIAGDGTDAAAASGGSLAGSHQGVGVRSSGHTDAGTKTGPNNTTGTALGSGLGSSPTTSSSKRASNFGRDISGDQAIGSGSGGQGPVATTRAADLATIAKTSSDLPRYGAGTSAGVRAMTMPEPQIEEHKRDTGVGGTGILPESHHFGHNRHSIEDSMPNAKAEEDTTQLAPITHERVRHLETEEVARVREHERHIHHIQHHTQPIIAAEELPEEHRELVHPVTVINEKHANKVEDKTLFEGQVHKYHDTLAHLEKERTVVDKGITVNQHIHHHVHHVIQPVIEKETVDKQRIRTTIPIHEITHEAPVVHQSMTHAPVALEHFLQRGGTLEGAIPQAQISEKVLHGGQCVREVDGVAETLERDLNLGKSSSHGQIEAEDFAAKKAAQHTAFTNVDQPIVAPVRN